MDTKEAKILIGKYKAGTCSPAELAQIDRWLLEIHAGEPSDLSMADFEEMSSAVWANVNLEIKRRRTRKLWPRIRVAAGIAAAIVTILLGIWFFEIVPSPYNDGDSSSRTAGRDLSDIAPGRSGATITLSTGEVIQLSGDKKGVVVGKELRYTDGSPLSPQGGSLPERLMMTAQTRRGQSYEFTLPDGTHVFLNADSKIFFPSQFSGKYRKIRVEGEAYFEVKKDKIHPFIVSTSRQTIEVLGTHFNVCAYENDGAMKTTLLEGKVAVIEGGSKVMLDPGDQAYSGLDGLRAKTLSNPEAAIDWKNGDFVFARESLAEIMRRVSRWYDVEIIYATDVDQEQTFSGKVSRSKNISQVIKALQTTGALKFSIEGRKVLVSN